MSIDVTTLALAKSYTNQHSGGGGQVQPDWNQNDETAKDYIKNRPFYTAIDETVLVEERTVPFADTGDGFYAAEFPSTFEATAGEIYKISWDGTVYECTCVDFNDAQVIGNLSIAGSGSDTGEPFLMSTSNVGRIDIATQNTSASHTFSISGFSQEVVKIDEKYLPDTVATKSEVESTQKVLDGVFSSVATFTFDKQTSGRDMFVFNAFHYYKISDFNPAPEDVISFKGTIETGNEYSEINIGYNCVEYGGIFIVVASAGDCSLHPLGTTTTKRFIAPSAGLYAMYEIDDPYQTARTGEFIIKPSNGSSYITGLLLKSSTAGSTKKFRITVNDDYNVSATNTSDSVSKALATTEYVDNSVSNPLNITSATVGQIAKISAVDASGKPTAWSPVDMPSGSGCEREWVKIGEVITAEDTTEKMHIKFTKDVNGNLLSLKGVLVIGRALFSDTNTHWCSLTCNDNPYGGNSNYFLYAPVFRNGQFFTIYSEFLRADGVNSVVFTAFNEGNVKQYGGCESTTNTWSPANEDALQFPMRGVNFLIPDSGLLAGSKFEFWGVKA